MKREQLLIECISLAVGAAGSRLLPPNNRKSRCQSSLWSECSKMSRRNIVLMLLLATSSGQQVSEARRDVQKYDFLSFGLGGATRSPLSSGRRQQVGLRTMSDLNGATNPIKRSSSYLVSPISDQIIHLEAGDDRQQLAESLSERYNGIEASAAAAAAASQQQVSANECRTIRTGVELSKDDFDKSSGQLARNCKGTVALNRCEGACSSSVLPSIKSRNGFKKECRCCNESSFRRIQVRLRECYSPVDNRRIIGAGTTAPDDEPNSYMDIEVEEPTDCRCRACEAYL